MQLVPKLTRFGIMFRIFSINLANIDRFSYSGVFENRLLSRHRQLKIALRNLRTAYRHYMEDRDVDSWFDMEHSGIKYERRLEKYQNFVEPRPTLK